MHGNLVSSSTRPDRSSRARVAAVLASWRLIIWLSKQIKGSCSLGQGSSKHLLDAKGRYLYPSKRTPLEDLLHGWLLLGTYSRESEERGNWSLNS